MDEVIDDPTDGSEFSKSSTRVLPDSLKSWPETTVTGATDTKLACGMRVPVTTISRVGSAGALSAGALSAAIGAGWASTGSVAPSDVDASWNASWASAGPDRTAVETNNVVARSR